MFRLVFPFTCLAKAFTERLSVDPRLMTYSFVATVHVYNFGKEKHSSDSLPYCSWALLLCKWKGEKFVTFSNVYK